MKKQSKCLPLMLIIVALLLLLYGCSKKEESQKKLVVGGGQEIKIAISLADMERDGNQVIKKIITERQGQDGRGQNGKQEQQSGQSRQNEQAVPVQAGGDKQDSQPVRQDRMRVNVTWLDAKNDPAQQEKDLDELLKQKVKAVILQPVDLSTGPSLVRKLAQANIKVIALGSLPADSPVDGYITFDHARTGELQARYLLGAAQGRSVPVKTVILQGDRNDQASREIATSALESLKGQQQVQVVMVKDHPHGNPQMAVSTLEQALLSTNNQIDAVLTTDSQMAAAVTAMLKNRGLGQRVITVGAGAGRQASSALVAGEHDAEVDIMPELIAQYAFDAAVGLATTGHWQYDKQVRNGGFDVPAKITPVRLITKDESYLLEQRWGKLTGQEGQQSSRQSGQDNQTGEQKQGSAGSDKEGGDRGEQGGGGKKTTLRVTTQDGKTVEVQIKGEIKKIETIESTGAGKEGGQGEDKGDTGGGGKG